MVLVLAALGIMINNRLAKPRAYHSVERQYGFADDSSQQMVRSDRPVVACLRKEQANQTPLRGRMLNVEVGRATLRNAYPAAI